ncbi:MAG TPA: L-fucose/L-arabinose isomerase family protein [Terriglobia bacterium]|nr:L-fucose/L-arabinose isomerase family protein [Terriglobia bacterium]
MSDTTLGVIIGNRGFFPDVLARDGREEILRTLEAAGYKTICLTPEDTKHGAVETLQEARKCADLFRRHEDEIDGIVVSLPNFGDERGVANALRMSGLDVPVLVQAFPDEPNKMLMGGRRDSFCGKMSVCNNLWQYGIRYTLTALHTEAPSSQVFKDDLNSFAATCGIVKGLKNLRVGVIGARPAAFNTVRFSEKLLEHAGITVEPLDLSEVFGRIQRLPDDDAKVKEKLGSIGGYVATGGIPQASLLRMAKFGVVVDEWMATNELAGTSIQCWTAMEEFFGVVPCTLMSMMSNNLLPSACETDMTGMVGMYVLQLASGTPSAIVDWNNNYGDDPDKCVIFHCSNLPKHFFENFKMDFQEIIAGSVGKENTFGTVVGQLKTGPITFCRVSTDDLKGTLRAYTGEGETTDDRPASFGGYGVLKVSGLQNLLHYICKNGYEHHVAVNRSRYANAVTEALGNYKRWDVYTHKTDAT